MQHGGHVTREPCDPSQLAEILDGAPATRSVDLTRSPEGRLTVNLWDCTAGTFRWHYTTDEIVHVLEGEVTITTDDGTVFELGIGDVAHFTRGEHATWVVPNYVKKLAVHRHQTQWQRMLGRARRLMPAGRGIAAFAPLLVELPV